MGVSSGRQGGAFKAGQRTRGTGLRWEKWAMRGESVASRLDNRHRWPSCADAREARLDRNLRTEFDCATCGACCRDAFDVVAVDPTDPMGDHADLTRTHLDGWRSMARVPGSCGGTQCAALRGSAIDGPWRCTIYDDRPIPCRTLEVGSTDCLQARQALGLDDAAVEAGGSYTK
jgi:Fe-S-cluster containining protein